MVFSPASQLEAFYTSPTSIGRADYFGTPTHTDMKGAFEFLLEQPLIA